MACTGTAQVMAQANAITAAIFLLNIDLYVLSFLMVTVQNGSLQGPAAEQLPFAGLFSLKLFQIKYQVPSVLSYRS
jgi:hypothetical protein